MLFEDSATLIRKNTAPSSLTSSVPYIGLEHIAQEKLQLNGIGESTDVTSTKQCFQSGDILFGKLRPYFRKVVRPNFDGICSTDIWVIRPKGDVDSRFLFYWCSSWGFVNFVDAASEGTRMPRAKWDVAQNHQIPDFTISEQEIIAHILGTLDDKIELNQKMNQTLEEIAKAIFKSWFVDFDPVRAKAENLPTGLPPEISDLFPDELMDSEIGEIPKGWVIRPISDLADCVGGTTPSTNSPDFWGNGTIMWATPKDLSNSNSVHLLNTGKKITELGLSKISSGLLPIGTVLLSSRAPVGYLAVTVEPTAINQGFIALKPKDNISNFYLFNWCSENLEEIKNRASGTTFAEISKKSFRPISAIRPSDELMSHLHCLVSPIYEKLLINDKESQVLASLRDTLLPKLISGELRIPDAEKFLEEADI